MTLRNFLIIMLIIFICSYITYILGYDNGKYEGISIGKLQGYKEGYIDGYKKELPQFDLYKDEKGYFDI